MKQTLITRGNDRLLILFAGWGCDAEALNGAVDTPEGYDTLIVGDYRTPDFDDTAIAGYREVAVIAWSFGVVAAARFLADRPALPLTLAAALNGTLYPVDDSLGIPRTIFDGTLANLDERNLTKFYRRTGFGAAESTAMAARMDIDALRDELRAIDSIDGPLFDAWDIAFVSSADRIIPPENQQRAWALTATPVVSLDGPHLPPLGDIARDLLVDKRLVGQRFGGSATTYDANATVQREIVGHLCRWLPGRLGRLLEVGSGSGLLTRELIARRPDSFTAIDLNAGIIDGQPVEAADAEVFMAETAPDRFDTIVSASTMQWFNSPRRFAARVVSALAPGGTAALSTFGPDNFAELDGLAPRRRYLSADEWRAILPDATIDEERIEILFENPADVLRHIKLTGVNALRRGSHADALRLLRSYPRRLDSRCSLTYHPIFITLRK